MKKVEELNYYELLNVEPSATTEEIEKAYLLSLATFRPDWFATYSVLSEAEREKSLQRAEVAFEVLRDPARRRKYDKVLRQTSPGQLPPGLVEKSLPPSKTEAAEPSAGLWGRLRLYLSPKDEQKDHPVVAEAATPVRPSLSEGYALSVGQYLRTVRINRGLSLETIAANTRINIIYLRALEEEHYDQLPSESYVRLMLTAYAKSLKIDAHRVIESYDSRRRD